MLGTFIRSGGRAAHTNRGNKRTAILDHTRVKAIARRNYNFRVDLVRVPSQEAEGEYITSRGA